MFFTKKEILNADSLQPIFQNQKKVLLESGLPKLLSVTPEMLAMQLDHLWQRVLGKVSNEKITIQGNIPLLIVAMPGNLQEKIEKIQGHTELQLDNIKNNSEVQSEDFFSILLDVEDGTKLTAKSAKESLKIFEKQKRLAFDLNESIALLTHYPNILHHHYLIVANSFYNKDNDTLPLLWLSDEDKKPELHYAWFDIAHGSYGAASYAIKIQ